MSERLTRKQLKEDPLLQKTASAADFASEHGRLLIGLAALVILVAVAVVFVRSGTQRGEDRAASMLAEARNDYANANLEPAAIRLGEIVSGMGGTQNGKQALLLLADIRFQQDQFAEAEGHYRRALDSFRDDPVLGMVARRGLAASLESQSRYDDAAAQYLGLAEQAVAGSLKAELLMDVARNYLKSGRHTDAIEILEDLSKNQDNARAARDAQLRLAEIKRLQAG